MIKTKLRRSVAMALAGAALSAGGTSTASATATTMYNLFHENGGAPCAPCSVGETDGWIWNNPANSAAAGDPDFLNGTVGYTSGDSTGHYNWAGTGSPGALPFGYQGSGTINWALHMDAAGAAEISNADSLKYGVSADIDTAKGAWSDNAVAGSGGWRHDLDFGLFKSDVSGNVTLNIRGVNQSGTNFGFTIFTGMSENLAAGYNHHGAWNSNNAGATNTASNLPGGNRIFLAADIVARSIGGAAPADLNTISFPVSAGQIYTIVLGGYRNGSWGDTNDGYVLDVTLAGNAAVPEPATLSLFGAALLPVFGAGRRRRAAAAG